ncbi:MAG: ATP-binding protein [Bryobacteraceae bacterium]|jgi:signal transduction histidine kinase/ActR/RegA family two-component response regulator
MLQRSQAERDPRQEKILAAQVRLLYANRDIAAAVTVAATATLGRLQWNVASGPVVLGWCVYMVLVAIVRIVLAARYARASPEDLNSRRWGAAFAIGAALAGAGWGGAGILLYPEGNLAHQVFLLFILGGMMLGAATLLASWPVAFVAFLVPTGLAPALRLLFEGMHLGDESHVAMGAMTALFTVATLLVTGRIHHMIVASLDVQFENRTLVEDLQSAKERVEALNERLEARVQERTAELRLSAEQLRAEMAQRREVEEELLRARKLESLGVLAGGIAHDFNNFLTVVQGNIEMAKMQLDSGHPVHAILSRTNNACVRAAFLASQLLTFAKGGAPVRQVADIGQLVRDAVNLARAGAQTTFEVEISNDLRSAEVDPGQIVQALHSILLNARQAMPEGGIVEVHAGNAIVPDHPESGARVRISIRDYGCGIPFDVLPRIFDPYFSTKPGASGLGLATAYAIISKHGGTLSVESKPGIESVFTIDLPASQGSPTLPRPSAPQLEGGTERVLIMDDEEGLRHLLQAVLTRQGYRVQTARDGAEAIALCEDAAASGQPFAVALLDLTVSGGMGGLEAAARLKELDPNLKLIVSSGYSDNQVMADFRKYGFDDVIRKPWVIADVSEVFRRLLEADANPRMK